MTSSRHRKELIVWAVGNQEQESSRIFVNTLEEGPK